MALTAHQKMCLYIGFSGLLSFVFGIVAELKKPPFGTPIQGAGVVVCTFPRDLSIPFGFLSIVTAIVCTLLGAGAVLCAKDVPREALFEHRFLYAFFHLGIGVTVTGVGMMLWATVTELLHHLRNVHHSQDYACPTAKTGLFGGVAFLHLDAMLFWLVAMMIIPNVREDLHRPDEDESEAQDDHIDAGYLM